MCSRSDRQKDTFLFGIVNLYPNILPLIPILTLTLILTLGLTVTLFSNVDLNEPYLSLTSRMSIGFSANHI